MRSKSQRWEQAVGEGHRKASVAAVVDVMTRQTIGRNKKFGFLVVTEVNVNGLTTETSFRIFMTHVGCLMEKGAGMEKAGRPVKSVISAVQVRCWQLGRGCGSGDSDKWSYLGYFEVVMTSKIHEELLTD